MLKETPINPLANGKCILDYGIIVIKNGAFLLEDFGFILDDKFEFLGHSMNTVEIKNGPLGPSQAGFNARALTKESNQKVAHTIVEGIQFRIESITCDKDVECEVYEIEFEYNGDRYACLQGYDIGASSFFYHENKNKPLTKAFYSKHLSVKPE